MFSTEQAHKLSVYVRGSKGALKKFGRIRAAVFHPSEPRLIGFVIRRPDVLLMVKRKECFLAYDRIERIEQGVLAADGDDSWDEQACKRLGVDLDQCVIWEGMPVRTVSGRELGMVRNVFFDEDDCTIDHIDISPSAANRMLLGSSNIPRSLIDGYRDGAIVVADMQGDVEESGGMAARAGVAWAKTKHAASESSKKAGEAINEGAYKAGEAIETLREKADGAAKQHEAKKREAEARGEYTGVDKAANALGRQLGRASGMFKDFKDEFDKASRGD